MSTDSLASPERWHERRSQFLESKYDIPEQLAEALAYSERGYSASGIADMMDVTDSTASGYIDRIEAVLGASVLYDSPPIPDTEDELNTESHDTRECPSCGESAMLSIREASETFANPSDTFSRELKAAIETGKTHLCRACHTPQTMEVEGHDVSVTGHYRNIPDELKELDRWIVWKSEERGDGKTKVPLAPWATDGIRTIDKSNPWTWASFDTAVDWAQKTPHWGLGFVFTDNEDIVGIDLDGHVEDGNLSDTANEIVDLVDSYTEVSPSGTGLHIICRGELPPGMANKNESAGVEIYDNGRYFTFTGRSIRNDELREAQDAIDELQEEYLESRDIELSEDHGGETGSPLYDITVRELYPELPVGENTAHPEHDSKTGANFKIHVGGETAVCWHGGHSFGSGDGCGLGAVHLLAMQATPLTDCDEVRERWRDDDHLVFKTWKYAVEELDLRPTPAPSRALRHLAEQVDMDLDADDISEQRTAYKTAKMIARQEHGIDVSLTGD